jgi:hypothetical protein
MQRSQKEETVSRWISLRYSSVVGLGEGAQSFSSGGGAHKEEGSEPPDLEQIPISHRIGQELLGG